MSKRVHYWFYDENTLHGCGCGIIREENWDAHQAILADHNANYKLKMLRLSPEDYEKVRLEPHNFKLGSGNQVEPVPREQQHVKPQLIPLVDDQLTALNAKMDKLILLMEKFLG